MRRSAERCAADPGPIVHTKAVGPGSAEQRCTPLRVRDTKRYLAKNRPEAIRGRPVTGQL